jgi:large subunit ribosomal protein L17
MRHHVKGKKFGRIKGQRVPFLRNLAGDLIRSGHIETTVARAKAIRPVVEKMVTAARTNDLATFRLLLSRLHNEILVRKLINDIAPRYKDRTGGYTRIIKLGKSRKRDGAGMATIEFV